MTTALILIFGLALTAAGLGLFWQSLTPKAAPALALRQIAVNWKNLLTGGPNRGEFLDSHEFGYTLRVPHHLGWYWLDAGPAVGSVGRVHVAPDTVARLPYEDRWHDGRRLLDASAFCLRIGNTASEVEYLNRGGRFQLEFLDDSMRSKDGHLMNCLVAVHFAVPHDLDDDGPLHELFDRLPHLLGTLRKGVGGLLKAELASRDYRPAMHEVPEILKKLNEAWAADALYADYRDLIQIRFSAMLIKPREEAERTLLRRLEANREHVKDRIIDIIKDLDHRSVEWAARWDRLRNARRVAVLGLISHVEQAIDSAAKGLAEMMAGMGTEAPVLHGVEQLFATPRMALEKHSDAVLKSFQDLQQFMLDLRAEREKLAQRFRDTRER